MPLRIFVAGLLCLVLASDAVAQKGAAAAVESPVFKVGGKSLRFPPPTAELPEAGTAGRKHLQPLVQDTHRLIAGYLTKEDAKAIAATPPQTATMPRYAMVQILRQLENYDCSAADFQTVVGEMRGSVGDLLADHMQETEDQFNQRMQELGVADEDNRVEFGKPVMLGRFFDFDDAYAFGMIVPVTAEGETTQVAGSCALLRVQNRVIYAYLYADYKDLETIEWLRKTSEAWARSILKANVAGGGDR